MNRAGITGESRLRVGCLRVNLFRFLEGVVAAVAVAVAAWWLGYSPGFFY